MKTSTLSIVVAATVTWHAGALAKPDHAPAYGARDKQQGHHQQE